MAANGISTLPNKLARKLAKIALAESKRQLAGTVGFRVLNNYSGSVSPAIGRPWSVTPPAITGGTASSVPTATIEGGNASTVPTVIVDGGQATSAF